MRPDHLTADKGYSSRANRTLLRRLGIAHTIPERADQIANRKRRGSRGGRPPVFDRERYKQRNQVERLMNRRKQFRAVATRYDKLAVHYEATVMIADILIWLRAQPDQSLKLPRVRGHLNAYERRARDGSSCATYSSAVPAGVPR
jgi:transposase